jgi:hypothetical protein
MVSNLVQMACQRAGLTEAEALKTGVLPPIALAGASAEYHVSGPQGMETDERTDEGRRLRGIAAPNVGLYTFSRSGTAEEVIGAAVLSSQETALAAAEQILFSENLKVTAAAGAPKMDKPLWPIIALVAFAVLLVEWLYFHRSSAWRTR